MQTPTCSSRDACRAAGVIPRAFGGMLLVLWVIGCASPPRPAVDPTPRETPAEAGSDGATTDAISPDTYAFEEEGEFPPPSEDVQFEEDLLPTPESVAGESLHDTPVDAEDLESLPELDPVDPNAAAVETPVVPSVQTPVAPSTSVPVAGTEPVRGRRGFRVQLVAVGDRAEAAKVAREAETRLAVDVYVVLEGQYFKVRAGDFVDRGPAGLLRDRARGNGYPSAWITPTEIRPETP